MAGFKKLGGKGNVVHHVVLPGPTRRSGARRTAAGGPGLRAVPMPERQPSVPPMPAPAPAPAPAPMAAPAAPAPDASPSEVRQNRRETALLQRRIEKLSKLLTEQEEQIRTLALRGLDEGEPVPAPIYNAVKPSLGTGERAEKKRAFMAQLFQANLELRESFNSDPR